MYKKLLAAALITSMLVLPVNSTGPAVSSEAPPAGPAQDYLPGDVPAQTDAAESMAPAFHELGGAVQHAVPLRAVGQPQCN